MAIYGYCRVSTPRQKIERQEANILAVYPNAIIIKEVYTRTKFQGRTEWPKLMKKLKPGDSIVFDSVSRMSGDQQEGVECFFQLYNAGIELIFLKEPSINTCNYRNAVAQQIQLTGTNVDIILQAINEFLRDLATEQIRASFRGAESEVTTLRQRTKEGVREAKKHGKPLGRPAGKKYETKKGLQAKRDIQKLSRSFDGNMSDEDCIRLIGVSKPTYYKYKRELADELRQKTTRSV